jgi:hypothetical protein
MVGKRAVLSQSYTALRDLVLERILAKGEICSRSSSNEQFHSFQRSFLGDYFLNIRFETWIGLNEFGAQTSLDRGFDFGSRSGLDTAHAVSAVFFGGFQ